MRKEAKRSMLVCVGCGNPRKMHVPICFPASFCFNSGGDAGQPCREADPRSFVVPREFVRRRSPGPASSSTRHYPGFFLSS